MYKTWMRLKKGISLLLTVSIIMMGFPIESNALSGTINFTGIDSSETGDTVTDGQTGAVAATDIAGIDIDIFGSNDKTSKVGKFIYLSFQNVITPSDVPTYTYNYIVIQSRDGSNFSLKSIDINNCNMTEDAVYVEGMHDGSTNGTVNLTLDAGGMPTTFNTSNGLDESVFGNVDKIVISSNTPSAVDVTAGIGTIQIGDPVLPSPPALAADTADNSVDNDLEITFNSDSAFESAVTGVTYDGNTLTSNQYTVSSGKITLKPSVSDNSYLRIPKTANVVVSATGYGDATVEQTINAGALVSLEVTTQPIPGSASGDAFGTQPVVKLKDQYGNYCTTGVASGVAVVASAKADTGSWTIGGTTSKAATSGTATFTNLTATLDTQGKGAVTFNVGGVNVDSNLFDIPLKSGKVLTADTTANSVDNDLEITFTPDPSFEGGVTAVSYGGNNLNTDQYVVSSGKITLKPSVNGNLYLRTPGTANLVITATDYNDSTVSQTINAGEVASLEVTTQPVPGTSSGDAFSTQPVVKLKDQYENYCSTGISSGDTVIATEKSGTGVWSIGGTTFKNAVAGTVAFTDLASTLLNPGDGAITFTSGLLTVDSSKFDIPLKSEKILTADTTANSVDNDLEITFVDEPAYRAAITAVKYDGNLLDSSQYDITQAGKLILKPSIAGNSYLRIPGTANVVISATGYNDSTVAQTINAGEATKLEVSSQPVPGAKSGDAFSTQPVVKLKDQYNNYCTTGVSSGSNIVAEAKAGTGSWTIGGTLSSTAVAGTATFTNLTAALDGPGKGAITFTSGTLTIDSSLFDIPLKAVKALTADTTDNSVDNDLEITFDDDPAYRAAITAVTYGGNLLDSSQYDTAQAGKLILKPSVDGNSYLRIAGTADVVVKATGYSDNTVSQTIKAGEAKKLEVSTQPVPGTSSGDEFATQPVVKLKDQYENYCSTGVSTSNEVVASVKNGTGSWNISGTTSKNAIEGTATFTNLKASVITNGKGAITFTSGSLTVDSTEFDIPLKSGKILSADTSDNSVDNDIEITFASDLDFESAVSKVTFDGQALSSGQYVIGNGYIKLKPGITGTANLKTPKTADVVITATGYNDSTISQTINAGEVVSLEISTQPVPGTSSGDKFEPQPIVKLKDQYGNYCSTGISSAASVIASSKSGTGSWTIGGTTTENAVLGVVEFKDLSASVVTNGKGAITFTSGSLSVDSNEFDIPLKSGKILSADTTDNSIDNDIEITFTSDSNFESSISKVTFDGEELSAGQYVVGSGYLRLKPGIAGNADLKIAKTGNIVILATGYGDSIIEQTINAGVVASLEISTQPIPGAKSGDLFKTQPVVKLKDQYNNYCSTGVSSAVSVVASAKAGTGSWTIGGTISKTAINGVVSFDNLSATLVSAGNGMIKFEASSIEADSVAFTIPSKPSSGGSTGGGTTPTEPTTPTNPNPPKPETKTEEKNVPVIINGKVENAGTETITETGGVKNVDMTVSGELVNKKIEEAVQQQAQTPNAIVNNVVEVPISATDANSINTKLTGDIVKKMDDNSFKLMINAGNVDYVIPAKELKIENVAKQMGVSANELKSIEVQVKIEKASEETAKQISENAAKKNMSVVVSPVEFSIVANTVSKDGTKSEVTISKFSQYVERVIDIPAGVDPSKITTGVVYNADGSFAHIPTEIVVKDSKYYARLNSPTNSKYSVVWNPVKVDSVKNHWSKESVEDMASRLVIDNPNSFEPNRSITRGEFIDVVTKGLGIYRPQEEAGNRFNDVNKASKYYNGVLTGVDYGLINGYKDGSFKPNQKITREEAMAIYAKAMDIAKLDTSNPSKLKAYKDSSKISSWAYESVDKVVASGIFSGRSASQISPKDNITCAEAVVAMRNLLVKGKLINE